MRADLGEPTDEAMIAKFRAILSELGAVQKEADWAMGVERWAVSINNEELRIFQDAWSFDIEGPDHLVSEILSRMKS